MAFEEAVIRDTILTLLRQRAPGKTICPSEAARILQPNNWRPLMEPIRAVAQQMAAEGVIAITQRGKVLLPKGEVTGPIRLRLLTDP